MQQWYMDLLHIVVLAVCLGFGCVVYWHQSCSLQTVRPSTRSAPLNSIHIFFISWVVFSTALMACVFIREVLKEHLRGLKACIQQHKIHYPAPHADHDNAEEIACLFHGVTLGFSKQSLQYLYLFFFLLLFFLTHRIIFFEIFSCPRAKNCPFYLCVLSSRCMVALKPHCPTHVGCPFCGWNGNSWTLWLPWALMSLSRIVGVCPWPHLQVFLCPVLSSLSHTVLVLSVHCESWCGSQVAGLSAGG